jgi:integrase
MKRKRRPAPPPIALSREELHALLAHAAKTDFPIYVLMLVQYWHAGRNSEMVHLTRKNFSGDYIHYERGKGSESCTQELVSHADPLLDERTVVLNFLAGLKGRRLYPRSRWTYWRHLVKLALAVGLPRHKANTKILKHSICTHLLEKLPTNAVQRRAGHVNGANTLRYAQLREEQVDKLVGELCSA